MIAGIVSERELLSKSLHTFLALQEKKKKKKNFLHIKVCLQFLKVGPSLVQLCLCCVICEFASCSLFQYTYHSAGANLRDVSPPPREVLAKPRTGAVSHKTQKHELLLQKHQAPSAVHPVRTHPL